MLQLSCLPRRSTATRSPWGVYITNMHRTPTLSVCVHLGLPGKDGACLHRRWSGHEQCWACASSSIIPSICRSLPLAPSTALCGRLGSLFVFAH